MIYRNAIAIATFSLAIPLSVRAATLLVPAQYPTIQAAIAASAGNDTILVSPGVYAGPFDLSNRFLKLRSAAGPAETILDGQNSGTVVTWNNAVSASILQGFQIMNGRGPNGAAPFPFSGGQSGGNAGAGGLRASGTLTVRDCIFLHNRGGDGAAGLDASNSGNNYTAGSGGVGGAGAAQIGMNVAFVFCTFAENRGGDGGAAGKGILGFSQPGNAGVAGPGGIAIEGAFTNIHLSRFTWNEGGIGGRGADANPLANQASQPTPGAGGGPGAITYYTGTVTVANCLFDVNRGGRGGRGGDGFSVIGGTLIAGGQGGPGGPGLAISSTQPLTLTQISTYANVGAAGGDGGAIQGPVGASGPGLVRAASLTTVKNSILEGDASPRFFPGVTASYSSITGGASGPGNIDTGFWPYAHGYKLAALAPFIDSASTLDAPRDAVDADGDLDTFETLPIDLAGRPRSVDAPQYGNSGIGPMPPIDMGAYEFSGAPTILPGDANCDGLVNNFDIDAFVLALTQPIVYEHVYRNCWTGACDTDGDGVLTNFDIDPFVALLVQ